jgi:hypothetical protein
MKGLLQVHWRTALFAVGFGGATVLAACATSGHPDPRPGITAAAVVPRAMLAGYPNEVSAYEAARQIPEVLDGLYCHCDCSKHSGHRSLLTCFESQHGASCEVCQREAMMAAQMHRQGSTLDQIRQAVDAQFGS